MMLDLYTFDVMFKDELVATVKMNKDSVTVDKFNNNPVIQPFFGGEITRKRIDEFLESRCFDRTRTDAKDILSALDLENYNYYSILSKTHGHMFHDCLWIKFPGENINWEEVKNGTC